MLIAVLLIGAQPAHGQYKFWKRLKLGEVKFGLGLDYMSEWQKSLSIDSASGTVTVLDLDRGTTETSPLDGDPRLLNRKFDLEWSLSGPGVRVPFTLETRWAQVDSSWTFQVLTGDFDLRFLDRREPEFSDSLHGRGSVFLTEIGAAGSLCRACPGFWESGYRFRTLPTVDAERSRPFSSPGMQVLSDETRLSRQTHDLFTFVGHKDPGDRYRSYAGVRHRWAEVEIEDELRLLNPLFNQETTLRSRTKLDSRTTDAIVGIETRLRHGSFIARTEITFNDEDYGLLAAVVYARSSRGDDDDPLVRRMAEIASAITPGLKRVADEFFQSLEQLRVVEGPSGSAAYLASDLKELLDRTERDLRKVFEPYPELDPLEAWARYRFQQVRQNLGLAGPPNAVASLANLNPVLILAQARPEARDQHTAHETLWEFGEKCLLALSRMAKKEQLLIELTFTTDLDSELALGIYDPYATDLASSPAIANISTDTPTRIKRGMYSFRVYKDGDPDNPLRACEVLKPKPRDTPCPFDLVLNPYPRLHCKKSRRQDGSISCNYEGISGASIQ